MREERNKRETFDETRSTQKLPFSELRNSRNANEQTLFLRLKKSCGQSKAKTNVKTWREKKNRTESGHQLQEKEPLLPRQWKTSA